MQQLLSVRPRRELDLEVAVVVVEMSDESRVTKNMTDAILARTRCGTVAGERQRHAATATALAHIRNLSVEDLLAARDDADRVAHPLGVLHHVRTEDDRLAATL